MLNLVFLVLIFVCIWIIYVQHSVVSAKKNAKKSFDNLFVVMRKKYDWVKRLTSLPLEYSDELNRLITDSSELISRIQKLEYTYENIDRIIALDGEFYKKISKITDIISEQQKTVQDKNIENLLYEYEALENSFCRKAKQYNLEAKNLRHETNVFPYSFAARLNTIKNLNCIKSVEE